MQNDTYFENQHRSSIAQVPAGDKEYNEPWTNEDGYIILTLNGPGRVSAGPLSKK